MLVHLIADYGSGDLAYAEVRQRLALHLPEADVVYTPVRAFDSLGAGFCAAQLALGDGPPDRLIYTNVAPREDADDPRPGNEGEGLVVARLAGGATVVGVNSTHAFSFLRQEAESLHAVELPDSDSQFRSRDLFPALLPRLLRGDRELLGRRLFPADVPAPPEQVVAYVDGYGNLKTTWYAGPAREGKTVQVRVGDVTREAVVGGGTFEVPAGELSFAPGSSGWPLADGGERRWWELLLRGGSAAELFGQPKAGTPVDVS